MARFAGKARTLTFHTWGQAGRVGRTPAPQGVASSNYRTGKLGGYRWGTTRKAALIGWESARKSEA